MVATLTKSGDGGSSVFIPDRIFFNQLPVGAVKFVIYDDREGSPTRGQFEEITLSPESCYQRLTVAPGLWMAFYGEGEGISMLMDIIPEPHDPSEASRMELEAIDYKF